jgi:hypothetical protein
VPIQSKDPLINIVESSYLQRAIEIFSFGIPLYWMVGMDASAASFFTYIALLICYTIGLKMMFSILAQCFPKKANVQGVGTFLVLLMTLFGGFIVCPNAYVVNKADGRIFFPLNYKLTRYSHRNRIPAYYIWIYWVNPMSWALQGLVSNEFMSDKYEDGEDFLAIRGFQVGRQWIGYSFLFMIPYTILSTVVLGFVLNYVRIEPERQDVKSKSKVSIGATSKTEGESFNLPFPPVDLTFDKLVYEVDSSTTNEKLKLLNEVSGAFIAGRMCALMG